MGCRVGQGSRARESNEEAEIETPVNSGPVARAGQAEKGVSPGRARVPIQIAASTASVVAALLLTLLILPLLPHSRMLLFYAAVVLSAWIGGFALGVLAIGLSVIAAEYWVFEPLNSFVLSTAAAVRVSLFVATSTGVVWMIVQLHRARELAEARARGALTMTDRLEEQAAELESQVTESEALTEELRQVNEKLEESHDRLERSAERTRRLQSVTEALLRPLTAEQVADVVLREGIGAVEADAGLIALASPDSQTARVEAHSGYPEEAVRDWRLLPLDAPLPITTSIRTGEAIWIADRKDRDARFPSLGDVASPNGSWAVLPLTGRDRTIGALALSYRGAGDWTSEDRAFLELLARQCAQAIERAQLYEAERGARVKAELAERQIAFLAEASTQLAASLDRDVSLGGLADLIVREMAFACLIHLVDDSGALQLAVLRARQPEALEILRALDDAQPSREATVRPDRVIESGRPELEPEIDAAALDASDGNSDRAELLRRLDPISRLAAPIPGRERVLGAITLFSDRAGRRYSPADLALGEELGRRAAQAIENARLYATTLAASQAKSDFLAVMSHELRTPLNAILGYADLVLLGVPESAPAGVIGQVERVRTAAQHLLRLVDEVLSFARIESGEERVRLEWIDAAALARETAALVEPLALEKNLVLETVTPDKPVEIETDVWKLRQILNNLLSNAVKFTSEGGIRLAVRRDPDGVELAIADTGIGIEEADRERIFDPFWQVEHTATRRYGGTGLGLGVARELSRMLGGELSVESEVGRGSTFRLRLPLRVPRPAPSRSETATA